MAQDPFAAYAVPEADPFAAYVAAQEQPKEKSLSGLGINAVNDILPAIASVGHGIVNTAKGAATMAEVVAGDPEARKRAYETGKGLVSGLITKGKEAIADPKGTAEGLLDAAYEHPVQAALTVDPLITCSTASSGPSGITPSNVVG